MRINAWHHSMAIARGLALAAPRVLRDARHRRVHARHRGGCCAPASRRSGGPGRHLAGNNTFSYFLDPHGNTVEYTTELETVDEDTRHPHMYDFSDPMVSDQWGTANAMNEFVAQKSFNDPDKGLFVAPRSDAVRHLGRRRRRHRRGRRRARCTPAARRHRPRPRRAGLPAALDAGIAALSAPAVPLAEVWLPPLAAGADGPRLRRVRGARRGRRRASGTAPRRPRVVRGADLLLHQPLRAGRAHDDVPVPRGRTCSTSSSRSPSWSAGTAPRSPRDRRASTSSATRSSTTGPPATCSGAR